MANRTLLGRRMLITGASRGIGRALAQKAAQGGARLLLTARTTALLDELAKELSNGGAHVSTISADISCPEGRQQIVAAAVERLGGLDVIVNNAGVGSWGHFTTSTEAILRQVMDVNFFAAAELIRLALPHLLRGTEPAIVNVASMCGRRGVPAWSEYSASKFALAGFTEALRAELARFDIDVLLIVPGLTRTDYFEHLLRKDGRMRIDMSRGMPVEDVAEAILNSLRRGRAETVLGREAKWILRVNRFLPRLLDRLMARRVRKLYQETQV